MKLKIVAFFLIFWMGKGSSIEAQIINFPDEDFLEYLLLYTNTDTNNDGNIQISEAEAYSGSFTINAKITNLGGIEYFKNLNRLGIYNTDLRTLDLSQNTKLQYLEIRQTKLASLDLSTNINLIQVLVDFNSLLAQVTVGSKPQLQMLSLTYNELVSADFSLCPKLTNLSLTENNFENINVISNPRLVSLDLGANKLTSLDVSNNTRLTNLAIGYNQIGSLNLLQNKILSIAMFQGNPLTTLDLSENTSLTQLVIDETNITELDISSLSMLQFFYANLSKLSTIDASENSNLIYINAMNSPSITSINFNNNYNKNVLAFFATNNPNLKCIQVDDPAYSSSQQLWQKDSTAVYASDCSQVLSTGAVNKSKMVVYPNPTQGKVFLTKKISDIAVYNVAGQLVSTLKDSSIIDLGKLPAGNYLIKTYNKTDHTTKVTKVIKN